MEVEAALLPPHIRLNNTTRRYALQALKLSPNHPIPVQIAQTLAKTPKTDINSEIDELAIEDYHGDRTTVAKIALITETQIANSANS